MTRGEAGEALFRRLSNAGAHGSGIGRGCVERFLAAGATVIGVDIIKADIEGIDNVKCDVGSVEVIEGLNQYIKEK